MINRSLSSLLFLGLFLLATAVPAWTMDLGDVIRALETPFQAKTNDKLRISDYSADFFQESKIASLDRLQRANGRVEVLFDYLREQTEPKVRFSWKYDRPTTQEIVSDGKTLWVHLPENNQVIQSNIELVNKARQNDPMTFLTGLGNLARDFQIGWAVPDLDADGNYRLELTPRRTSALINRLVIVVDRFAVEAYKKQGDAKPSSKAPPTAPPRPTGGGVNDIWFPILSTAVYDANGNSTVIEFSNLRVNLGIPVKTFDFMMPPGVQVIRPTSQDMGF
jgi:outer membrane lipoprotein carrier protein